MISVYKNKKLYLALAAAVILVLYLFFLPAPFYFDDFYNIVYNPDLVSPLKAMASKAGGVRPLAYLWFYFDKTLFGFNPLFFRLENIFFHIVNFFLVFLILRKLTSNLDDEKSFLISLFASLLWALNPVNSQSVAYIVQRMNELSTTFILVGFVFYLNFLTKRKPIDLVFFILSFLLSLGFKETGILLIPLCILYYAFFVDFKKGALQFAVFLLFCIAAVLLIPPLNHILPLDYLAGHRVEAKGFNIFQRLLTAPGIVLDYIIVMLVPLFKNIHLYYSVKLIKTPFAPGFAIPSLILFALFLRAVFYSTKDDKLLSFSLIAFFMLIFPESFLLPLDLAYQHRMYLPSVFLIFAFVLLLFRLEEKKAFAVLGFFLVFFSLNLAIRGFVFSNPVYFYKNELKHAPQNVKVYINASKNLLEEGRLEECYQYLKTGLDRFPDNPQLAMNLGLYLARRGDIRGAIFWYKKALKKDNPFLKEAYWNLAVLYAEMGNKANALHYLNLLKDNFDREKIKKLKQKIEEIYSADAVSE